MKIEFIKIEIQNFKSVGELVTLNYADLKGLNFVYGKNLDVPNAKNGSGKTSILVDSLAFALFGKTLKNTNNKYIPNRQMTEKLKPYVKVYFKSDNQLYSCETYGKVVARTMSTISMELLKLNDDFSIKEDLTQSSVNKTKQYILENILGCSFNIFKSSIIVSYADFMNFYEGMNKDQKRKYIETIFNLDCFGNMFNIIKSDLNDTKKEITNSKNEIIKLSDLVNELTDKFNNFDESLKLKRDSLKEKLNDKVLAIKKMKDDYESIICEDTDAFEIEKQEIKSKIAELNEVKTKFEKIKIKKEMEINHINNLILEMKKINEGLCEKCVKLISNRYDYDNKQIIIAEATEIISKIDEKLITIEEAVKKYNTKLLEVSSKIRKNDEKTNEKNKIKIGIDFAKREAFSLKESYDEVKEGTANPFESLLNDTKLNLKELKDRLFEYNKNEKHLEILKEACSENGVKKFIMKDIVKLLNSLIQKYLNEIGSEFIVFFDETFDFKFLTSTGECEFNSFSAGERQRIQISTILAFRDIILNGKISSNIMIIDELLDANIDTACIENVMKILKRKAAESNQNIFIISHRSELADNESIWDNIIKVTKENGQSTYEVK